MNFVQTVETCKRAQPLLFRVAGRLGQKDMKRNHLLLHLLHCLELRCPLLRALLEKLNEPRPNNQRKIPNTIQYAIVVTRRFSKMGPKSLGVVAKNHEAYR